jgi:hypothetical protein
MYASGFLQPNFAAQMIVLPLVIGELLLNIMFSDIRELFANPSTLLVAIIFHVSFFWLILKITVPRLEHRNCKFHLPLSHLFFQADHWASTKDRRPSQTSS